MPDEKFVALVKRVQKLDADNRATRAELDEAKEALSEYKEEKRAKKKKGNSVEDFFRNLLKDDDEPEAKESKDPKED